MNSPRSRCPVCWRKVDRTIHALIAGHWDTAGALCEGGGEPYYITIVLGRPGQTRWQRAYQHPLEEAS